ncbi:hypothetical protein [Bacillus sp. ISL-55]|uniref:hypothetical protein n=1 Tax=Bacillus sp. ISL-55 TaxID=2819134 RepID=UPI001BE75E1D|nr:hypothetical protein [Bacillus sp. ISL-55]MBT2695639.1 hypothetical protein [Bacillus sp. ISL-55]
MKSFFDFNGRTEATRGARRWSWIKKTSCSYPHPNNFINSLTITKGREFTPRPAERSTIFMRIINLPFMQLF